MCTSCGPEPVNEQPGGVTETRGGDRFADITVPEFAKGTPAGCDDPDCACCNTAAGSE